MIRTLLLAAAFCAAFVAGLVAPARADVRDVSFGAAGDRVDVVIVFDGAATAASAAPSADGVLVRAAGLDGRARVIETTGSGPLRAIAVAPGEGGLDLDLKFQDEPVAARAFVEGRTLRVAVRLAAPVLANAPVALSPHAAPSTPIDSAPVDSAPAGVAHDAPETFAPTDHGDAAEAAAHVGVSAPRAHDPSAVLGAQVSARPGTPSPSDDAGGPDGFGDRADDHHAADPHHAADGAADDPRADRSRPTVIAAGGLDDEACRAAETTLREDPWNLDALRRYASCLAIKGDLAGAQAAFERLLTFEPDDIEAQIGLAATEHERGDAAVAAEVYGRLLEEAVGDGEAARLRALLAVATASSGEAAAHAPDHH